MSDIDDELRELFQRRADDVPPHTVVPPTLARRGRRRFTLNAMGVGLGVALVAAGAFAGVRALGGLPAPLPVGSSNPPPTQTTPPGPSASTNLPCIAAQLRAVASLQGAAGSQVGEIVVTNLSGETCTLDGMPVITLLDQSLNAYTSGITFSASPAGWEANRSPTPPGWPVVTLRPGASASVRISWSNWCLDIGAVPRWRIAIPGGGGTVDVGGFDATSVPPCNGPGGPPSTIEEGPFEPSTGS